MNLDAVFDVFIGLIWVFNIFGTVVAIESIQGVPLTKYQWLQLAWFPIFWLIFRLLLTRAIKKQLEVASDPDRGPKYAIATIRSYFLVLMMAVLGEWGIMLSIVRTRHP